MIRFVPLFLVLAMTLPTHPAGADDRPHFVSIVLGAGGGPGEGDLSSYLVGTVGGGGFLCLDAGSVLTGIERAAAAGNLEDRRPPDGVATTHAGWVLREHVKAYLISHAHLDHVAGLVLNSPADTPKPILASDSTIGDLRDHLFNWRVWPNFGDEGVEPCLGRYSYVRTTGDRPIDVAGTGLQVRSLPLSHSDGYPSTAFLIGDATASVLYLGDTGADDNEPGTLLADLWRRIAPEVRSGRLRGIFIEVSYTEDRPAGQLYGHLKPSALIEELGRLARVVSAENPERALANLTLLITHVKPDLVEGRRTRTEIEQQLAPLAGLGLRPRLVRQGDRVEF